MLIGIVPDPERHRDWPQMKAFLEPAAQRGGVPVLERDEAVWAIYDGLLTGAATARLTTSGFGEIVLVGGLYHRRWINKLDHLIGEWMKAEGMESVRAYGRKGWVRVLNDWKVMGECDGMTGYERAL